MKLIYPFVFMFVFCFCIPAHSTIYKWMDDSGQVHFTDAANKIPEKYKEKAKDFDKVNTQGSVTYDPALGAPSAQTAGEEPFWKRFLREEEQHAKKDNPPNVILYMTDW